MVNIDDIKIAMSDVVNKDAIEGIVGMTAGFVASNLVANESDSYAVVGLPFGITGGYIETYIPPTDANVDKLTLAKIYPKGETLDTTNAVQTIVPETYRRPITSGDPSVAITDDSSNYAKYIMQLPEVAGDDGLLERYQNERFVARTISRVVTAVGFVLASDIDAVYRVNAIDLSSALRTAAATSVGLGLVDAIGTFVPSLRSIATVNKHEISQEYLDTKPPLISSSVHKSRQSVIPATRQSSVPLISKPRSVPRAQNVVSSVPKTIQSVQKSLPNVARATQPVLPVADARGNKKDRKVLNIV